MPEGLQSITQADFSAGAFPGYEDVPVNGVEDIVDGFLRDDAAIERRGGTQYKSNADHFTLSDISAAYIWDGVLAVGPRTVAIGERAGGVSGTYVSILNPSDDASPLNVTSSATELNPSSRVVELAGMLLKPAGGGGTQDDTMAYAGATSSFSLTGGTISITQGSKTVTGVGTSFSSGTKGGVVSVSTSSIPRVAAVATIESNTSMTLVEEWPYASVAGSAYAFATGNFEGAYFHDAATGTPVVEDSGPAGPDATPLGYLASMDGRLVVGQGNRIMFSSFIADSAGISRSAPYWFSKDDFHLLPTGALIVGMQPFREQLLIFTTTGVWALSNLAYDLTDDLGNPQQQLSLVNQDVRLWGDVGISTWNNGLVIPALDDLILMGADGTKPVTNGGRKLYREYVKAGYRVGQAAVHRGHYLLPVLPDDLGEPPVDVLVWRLDAGNGLVRWAGHAGTTRAFTVRTTDPSRSPKLLGGAGRRIIDLTDCFEPSSTVKSDATGTAHQLKVTSRSIMLSETQEHTLRFGRIRYELDDAGSDNPTFTAEWSRDRPGSSFTALSGSASEGEDTFTWPLAKAGQQTRMRFTSNNAAAKAVVRAMEFKVRQHGRT